jgi:hypothetical protein
LGFVVSKQVEPAAEFVELVVEADLAVEFVAGAVPLVVGSPVGQEEC